MEVSQARQLLNSTAGQLNAANREQHEYVAMKIAEMIHVNGMAPTMRDFKLIMKKAQAHFVRKHCEEKKYNRKKAAKALHMSYRALLYNLDTLKEQVGILQN